MLILLLAIAPATLVIEEDASALDDMLGESREAQWVIGSERGNEDRVTMSESLGIESTGNARRVVGMKIGKAAAAISTGTSCLAPAETTGREIGSEDPRAGAATFVAMFENGIRVIFENGTRAIFENGVRTMLHG